MKTQAKQNVSHPRLVALGLLMLLMAVTAACADPCRRPAKDCKGRDTHDNSMKFDINLVDQMGCGEKVGCVWANSEGEANECAIDKQHDPTIWRVSPTPLTGYAVAACNSTTKCCDEWSWVWAPSPASAQQCKVSAGSSYTEPSEVYVYKMRCSCKGTYTIDSTANTTELENETRLWTPSARSEGDAETCITHAVRKENEAQIAALNMSVNCDCDLQDPPSG